MGPLRCATVGQATQQLPHTIAEQSDLPNGWRITPAGKPIAEVNDLVLDMTVSKDGKVVIASHSGYQPHGIDVIDVKTQKVIQHIELKTTWLGFAYFVVAGRQDAVRVWWKRHGREGHSADSGSHL